MSDETIDIKSFENLLHEKAVDHIALYAKANQFGAELFPDLTTDERKQKFENEVRLFFISRIFLKVFFLLRFLDYNKKLIYKIKFVMK